MSDIEQLRKQLEQAAQRPLDPSTVWPLIVPTSYFAHWDIPNYQLPCQEFSVTWATMSEPNSIVYLTHERAQVLVQQGYRIPNLALHNLTQASAAVASHEKRGGDGTLYWLGLMHADGLGPSRLLLQSQLAAYFPDGYSLALPEITFGLALSKNMPSNEWDSVKDVISQCFLNGTSPMSPKVFDPEDFMVPEEWFGSPR